MVELLILDQLLTPSVCGMCLGLGRTIRRWPCPFCNGSGHYNELASKYIKHHYCDCPFRDRKCLWCHKACHCHSCN
jgi:hypothetical protein